MGNWPLKINRAQRGLISATLVGIATWASLPAVGQNAPFQGPGLFYDAERTGLSKGRKVLEGNVVLIAAGNVLAADKIVLDSDQQRLDASGHVVFIGANQVISGTEITYFIETTDFKVEDALMANADPQRIEKLRNRLLGFSQKELAFETDRKRQLQQIALAKKELQQEARDFSRAGQQIPDSLIERYGVLLGQEEAVKQQTNPSLAGVPPDRRRLLESRREYWKKSRSQGATLQNRAAIDGYFRLEGESLERTNGNDYIAKESLWTPCRCEDDESPAWAFRSDSSFAQQGGYIDLYHPVLEIKGIPILYLPYLKLPLKDQRQSGFLPPTLAFDDVSGNTFSQPVYFDFAPNADATLFTDIFERRGTRLGLEFRYQQREHSGWEMRFESIRDRLWLDSRGLREDLLDYYSSGLTAARAKQQERQDLIDLKEELEDANDPRADDIEIPAEETAADLERIQNDKEWARLRLRQPDYWKNSSGLNCLASDEAAAECQEKFNTSLNVPTNTWRGQLAWRGLTFFAPRLSLISHGEITSDHRYTDELFLPDDVRESFFTTTFAKSFNVAKAQIHLDNPEFYLGVGGRFGDSFLLEERFAGQQVPVRFKTQSRFYNLLPRDFWIPIYSQMSFEQLRITQYGETDPTDEGPTSLGSGSWRKLKVDTVSPLLSDTTISVSQFTELEARFIEASSLGGQTNEIKTWRTGLDFRLPIDGKGRLPDAFQDDDKDNPGDDYVHHLMDWGLLFSIRPSVVRRGPYGDPDTQVGQYAYFAGDGFDDAGTDETDVLEDERLEPHQRITFSTTHRWRLFKRAWDVVSGKPKADGKASTGEQADREERARRELLYSLDRPVTSVDDIFSGSTWFVNRYTRQDKYYADPVTFNAAITYDILRVKTREEEREENRNRAAANNEIFAQIAEEEALGEDANDTKINNLRKQLQAPLVSTEPWIGPSVGLTVRSLGFALASSMVYSIYTKVPRKLAFNLALPTVFKTSTSLSYTIDKERIAVDLDFEDIQTKVRGVRVVTNLIPHISTFWSYNEKEIDDQELIYKDAVEMRYGFEYSSPSECWGLRFRRDKEYGTREEAAKYVLQLSVIFMGRQERALPNMAPNIERQIGREDTDNT